MAIIITIMVLELKIPHGDSFEAIKPLLPVFLSYVLSFIYIGIYWNNHHHMLQATRRVNGRILLANLNFLFWLSLFPFATGWMGENHVSSLPTAVYGAVLLLAAIAYTILQMTIIKHDADDESTLARAIGSDVKGKFSMICYASAIPLAFFNPWISNGLYVLVAAIWFIPDRRIEKALEK